MKILIVDDNQDARMILKKTLESDGYDVDEASDGEKALRRARTFRPDMIISDILMPVMDGFKLCRTVKGDEKLKPLPFVFYTATYTGAKDEDLALKMGADRFIRKPVEPKEFIKIIREVIKDAVSGNIIPGTPDFKDEGEILKLYDERLVKKLEKKMLDLERETAQRKEAEKALLEAKELFEKAINDAPIGMAMVRPDGYFNMVNQAFCEMTGYEEKELLGNTDLMLMEIRKDHPFYKGLKEIRNAATGAASLSRQLLAFSRKQVIQPEIINLNDVINATAKMLVRLISENIELQMFLDPALEPVEADNGQMEQVIINLAVNARDAMPAGGKLTVETKNLDLNEDFFKSEGVEGKVGPYVMLRVSDTGSGMDQEIILHIFDPFFTTKGIERGTGLGLSTVYGIIKQNNGYIFVDSKHGKGSAFEIYLPAAKRERKPVAAKIVAEDNLTGSETILLVEDDMQLQKLTARILKRYGYRVLQASNGAEALKVSQKHDGPIDLILADVIMPGMNVREMTESIQFRRKEARVLYMSGYMDDTISHHGVLEHGINFLQKPYTPEYLARRVREVLDKRIDDWGLMIDD